MSANLLLKFRSKDTSFGVSRETLKALSTELDMAETAVVHIALANFARATLPAYEADDGPLTESDTERLQQSARAKMPTGRLLSKKSLLD
jgi:hypothetical protein